MRVLLLGMAVVLVFGALLVIDTAALLRLTWYRVTGGCGVSPMWIATGGVALVLGAWLWARRRPVVVKKARVPKTARPGKPRAKSAKPKRAK